MLRKYLTSAFRSFWKQKAYSSINIIGLTLRPTTPPTRPACSSMPVSWWLVRQFLRGYAYRIDLSVGVFLLAGALALGIAGLTVGYQSVRAALANPVDSLRNE